MASSLPQVGQIMELLTSAQGQGGAAAVQAAPAGAASEDDDGAGQRGRKRAMSGRPQDERLAAVQEKNRKAQKRFRERQKEKMSTMEAEIAEKDRQLTTLREENSSLAGRNAVLEKVLALREEQLKQHQGGAVDTSQQLAVLGYTPLAGGGAATTAGLLPPTSTQASMLPPAAGLLTGGSNPGGGADKQGPNAQWMDYVHELSKLTEDKASPTSERRLTQVVSQAAQLSARNAPFVSPANGAARDAGNVDPARWKSIASNMGATSEQRAEVKRLRDEHLQRLHDLQVARHPLTANVTAAAKSNNTAQMEAATTELRNSLQEESEANVQIMQEIYIKVLTPKQFGKAVVQSYPFYLDGMALVELLAGDGQPQPQAPPVSLPPGMGPNALFANLAMSQPELLASLAAGMPIMPSGAIKMDIAPAAAAKTAGSS